MSDSRDQAKQPGLIWAGGESSAAERTQPAAERTQPAAERTQPAAERTQPEAETTSPSDAARLERHQQLVRRIFAEIWNQGDFSRMDEFFTPDFVDPTAPAGFSQDRQGYVAHVSMLRAAFPDFQVTVEQVLAEEGENSQPDRTACRITCRGTHQGSLFGIPATGKPVTLGGMVFAHFKGDKISQRWAIFDIPGLMQQIGVAGQPPAAH